MSRLDRLRERLAEPLLVTNPVSVRYLTGFVSSNGTLLVEAERVRLYTDFRYATAARAVEGVEFVETARFVLGDVAGLLDGRFGIESDHLTVSQWEVLRAGGLELVPHRGLVEGLRAVKDEAELEAMRRASEISDRGYDALAAEPFIGRTEKDLAWTMERLLRENGGEGLSFEVAVGSGPNAALPHVEPGDRVVQAGELVVVDAGCVVDGYCSDCTRTFAIGAIDDELRRIYAVTLDAQSRSLDAVRAGAHGAAVDRVSRDVIGAAGYGEFYGHGLGHGVGLQVHEAPVLRPESTDTLEPGNCVTVEPGIYLPGRAGVRIEDLVVVTEDGCEVLTKYPKELVTVG
ncbi:MAG TPA: Xaa-Pro peptidase family protein [Gaiellaceae bacterium]